MVLKITLLPFVPQPPSANGRVGLENQFPQPALDEWEGGLGNLINSEQKNRMEPSGGGRQEPQEERGGRAEKQKKKGGRAGLRDLFIGSFRN